jgi:hypothetical protein
MNLHEYTGAHAASICSRRVMVKRCTILGRWLISRCAPAATVQQN